MPDTGVDASISERVKTILRRDLKLGANAVIDDDMPLIGGDFELDSLDMVMLVTSVEKEFGVKIADVQSGHEAFASVGSLVRMIQEKSECSCPAADATEATAGGPTVVDLGKMLAGLPHQPPFRFITRLTELTPMVEGRGEWVLTGQEAFFAGHFPGQPLVPGVLISEALAQLSGLVGTDPAAPPKPGRLAQVDVRFRKPVAPPATLTLQARLAQAVDALQHYDVSATFDGAVVADGRITLARG